MTDQSATEQVSVAESFRDRIAKHIDGYSPPSNYEAMIAAISRRVGPPPCTACSGNGFITPSPERLKAYRERMSNLDEECKKLTRQAHAPEKDEGDYERAKDDQEHRKHLAVNVQRIQKNMFDERWAFKQQFKCSPCNGSGLGKRTKDRDAIRPDAIFTTVTCPECRGIDDREHDLLVSPHRGSSAGKLSRSTEYEFFPSGATCSTCKGDAFVSPISVRPVQKTAEVLDDLDESTLGRHSRRRRRAKPRAPENPAELIEQLQETAPLVAVAVQVMFSEHGDRWAKDPLGYGRSFSIWPILPAGQAIIREATVTSPEDDWYTQQIDIIRLELEKLSGSAERAFVRLRTLRDIATGEALQLEAKVDAAVSRAEAAA